MGYGSSYSIGSIGISLYFEDESTNIILRATFPNGVYDSYTPFVIFCVDMTMFH